MTSPKKPAEQPSEPAEEAHDAPPPENVDIAGQLRARVEELEQELAGMRDQWMRAVAEADNIRKRAERDQQETARYAVTAFARDMVQVLENLTRACDSIPESGDNELLQKLGEGVDLTLRELLSIFEKYHIRRIDPQGQPFDHNFHQAVVQVERDDVPPGTVVQVIQAGYVIHDRLLRPAMVAVSKAPGDAPNKVDTTA